MGSLWSTCIWFSLTSSPRFNQWRQDCLELFLAEIHPLQVIMDPHFDFNLGDNIIAWKRHFPTPPPPKKKNKTEGKCGLCKHPRLRFFRTEQSWCFVFMILNICFFSLLDFSSLNILGFVLWKGKSTFFQILFLLVVTLLRTEPSARCSFWQKLDCVFSQLHSWIWRFRVLLRLYWIRYTCEWNTNTIHLSPQRTKIWTKYSKDIETYVDKRAHLGKSTFNWFLNTSKILSQPLASFLQWHK